MSTPLKSPVRVDIQILRAIAVLAVVISHFWPSALPNGFAGVDVFFVVSGFLITSLIVREVQETGTISLARFWMRRIRRIFPAAITVIIATVIAVQAIGLPTQLRMVADHAIASTFSAINLVLAWESTDYNARTNATSPFQHFWSLAVEEQFYLVWPLLVIALVALSAKLNRTFQPVAIIAIGSLGLLSLGYAVVGSFTNSISYFDPAARAWELSLGAAVAFSTSRFPTLTVATLRRGRLVAWTILIGSLAVPGLGDAVPGVGVLPSVLPAAVLVGFPLTSNSRYSALHSVVTRALVWVGDRSYSLYLWHWPALILAPYFLDRELALLDSAVVVAATLVASDLSFRFIENPVRFARQTWLRRPATVGSIAIAVSFALTASILSLPTTRGISALPNDVSAMMRDEPMAVNTGGMSIDFPFVTPHCGGAASAVFECPVEATVTFDQYLASSFPESSETCQSKETIDCVIGDVKSERHIALVGDSHSRTWWLAFDLLGKRAKVAVHLISRLGCAYRAGLQNLCGQHNEKVRTLLLSSSFDLVVFTHVARDTPSDAFRDAYADLVKNDVPMVVLADNPGLRSQDRQCVDFHFPAVDDCAPPRKLVVHRREPAVVVAHSLAIPVIDLSDIYCSDTSCRVSSGGMLIHKDRGHMFPSYVATLAPFLWSELKELGFLTTVGP